MSLPVNLCGRTVDAIAEKLDANDGTFRDLVHEVVNSLPFREAAFPAKES